MCPSVARAGTVDHTAAPPPDKGMATTPDRLADALIRAVGPTGARSWLDPSVGSGQLIGAAIRAGVPTGAIMAIDLQTRLPKLEDLGVNCLLGTDFLRWAQQTERRFDRVIANPPFVRISKLEDVLRRPALETRVDGFRIPGAANYWVAFLTAGMRVLRPGGSLAYILPAAWEYANYARDLRTLCESSFQELDVHRVAVPMFEVVSDGCVLLVGRGFGRPPRRPARAIGHGTLDGLVDALGKPRPALEEVRARAVELPDADRQVRFGEIANVRVGAVTGDARFFLLNEARRLDLGLPESTVRPVLSKARHIAGPEVDRAAWERLLAEGGRVWLFDPSKDDLSVPAVREYLDLPEAQGGCRRTAMKIRQRDPWYRTPMPAHFDGFVSGMSEARPWVALNLMPNLTASNTLYGVSFRDAMSVDEKAAWCLSMLSSASAESRARLVRRYPQGLLKLEPGDMACLAVQRPNTATAARELYHRATDLIMAGRPGEARAIADDWLQG